MAICYGKSGFVNLNGASNSALCRIIVVQWIREANIAHTPTVLLVIYVYIIFPLISYSVF